MAMRIMHFARLLETYGADLGRWPPADATPARALLAEELQAQALLRHAAELDAALRSSRATPDAAALERMRAHVARHVATMPIPARAARFEWLRALLPVGGGALAALAVCGIWLAFAVPPTPDTFNAPRQIAMIESTE